MERAGLVGPMSSATTGTRDTDFRAVIRQDIEKVLGRGLPDIDDEHNLIGLGLDSMKIMQLAETWRSAGFDITFAGLASDPTLAGWTELVRNAHDVATDDTSQAPDVPLAEPFALTPVQRAYWAGRKPGMVLGGVGCHAYFEFDGHGIDPARLERAVLDLSAGHPMLRARFDDPGTQQILQESPWRELTVRDLRVGGAGELASVREELSHRLLRVEQGEVFDVQLSLLPGGCTRLHVNIDLLAADVRSIGVLLKDLARRYADPASAPPAGTGRSFAEHVRQQAADESAERQRAVAYWRARMDAMPKNGPELPLATAPERIDRPRFSRREHRLSAAEWSQITGRAEVEGLTPAAVLATAYGVVLAEWSGQKPFLLNVPMFDRRGSRPEVADVVADFTSLILLAVQPDPEAPFVDQVRRLQDQLHQDVSACAFSAVDLLAEWNRRCPGERAEAPVVFACNLGEHFTDERFRELLGEQAWMLSQTPQVWLDHQVYDAVDGGVVLTWDVVDELFPGGVVDAMFAAYQRLLGRLAGDADAWTAAVPSLVPSDQLLRRAQANSTEGPLPRGLLQDEVLRGAREHPDRKAVVSSRGSFTYGELLARSIGVAEWLGHNECADSEVVAVVMDKGWEQVAGVLGVLLAGGAYLPVDTGQPPARRARLLRDAGVRLVLTQSWTADELPPGMRAVAIDQLAPSAAEAPECATDPDALAYVIYTSGSTGAPKGVLVSHRSARNTIDDINRRFRISGDDRVLGLSGLGFDLSVYDLFGPLAVGGALVLPDPAQRTDPSQWAELILEHHVTVWNSVPAQLQMLRHFLQAARDSQPLPLRLALLSGDWIPVRLPEEIRSVLPGLEVIGLGGATEAAIWSIHFPINEVSAAWSSIPYGKPLTNQRWHVLDPAGRPAPDLVSGELYIGGAGVAQGYLGDEEKTAQRFVHHPGLGERLYRTGDFGRYLPDGDIEFLGRQDDQVKILGHRVELAEVEAALEAHRSVGASAVITDRSGGLGSARLAGFVEGAAEQPSGAPGSAESLVRDVDVGVRAELESLDRVRFGEFRILLDRAELLTMTWSLQDVLPPGGERSVDEICTALPVAPAHRRLLRRWLRGLCAEGMLRAGKTEQHYRDLLAVDRDQVDAAWNAVEGARPDAACRVERMHYLRRTAEQLPKLLRGEQEHVRSFFPEGGLGTARATFSDNAVARYLNGGVHTLVSRLAEQLGTAQQSLNILEVGAGIGGTSAELIPRLSGLQVNYLFTDVSQFFLNEAYERFHDEEWVRYGLFDMNSDYRNQGFEPNSFDVVLCAHVLHNAFDVGLVLQRLHELLRPSGWLIFTEATREHYELMASMEFLVRLDPDRGDFRDFRAETGQLFLDAEQWSDQLRKAGGQERLRLPGAAELGELCGQHLFAAQFKTDRKHVDLRDLTTHLAAHLPPHMIPGRLEVVDALPQTGNGKIDRDALRRWSTPPGRAAVADDHGAEPADGCEARIAQVWAGVLNLPRVGRNQSFFDLGGDSLLVTQLVSRIRDGVAEAAGRSFEELLGRIMRAPTVAQLAAHLTSSPEQRP